MSFHVYARPPKLTLPEKYRATNVAWLAMRELAELVID